LEVLHDLAEKYSDRVAFYIVYIREAHPEEGWVLEFNRDEDIAVDDPTTDDERHDAAVSCALRLKIRIPVVIDKMDDAIARAYGGWPDRLYLISTDGRVAFQGEEGPRGFQPADLEEAIERELMIGS
jgi:hypothetical protein